jgi:hypothetical protein
VLPSQIETTRHFCIFLRAVFLDLCENIRMCDTLPPFRRIEPALRSQFQYARYKDEPVTVQIHFPCCFKLPLVFFKQERLFSTSLLIDFAASGSFGTRYFVARQEESHGRRQMRFLGRWALAS